MTTSGLDAVRDGLLAMAREVVLAAARRGDDPAAIAAAVRSACAVDIRLEPGFQADPETGVESLAFVVDAGALGAAGGLILRLPGELPDSFEPVLDLEERDPAAVRRRFFES